MATIKQKSVSVEVEGFRLVEVRRMKWKPASEFIAKLGGLLAASYREGDFGAMAARDGGITLGGIIQGLVGQLPKLIGGSTELLEFLAKHSTDLKPEEFDGLDALAASEIIKAAVSVNCDEELKNCWAGIAGAIRPFVPAKTQTS